MSSWWSNPRFGFSSSSSSSPSPATSSSDSDKQSIDPSTIPTWLTQYPQLAAEGQVASIHPTITKQYPPRNCDHGLSNMISVWRGDICRLNVDAIVNAANTGLWAGGGVCGAIHSAAGSGLQRECDSIGGCPPGLTVLTGGYRLPARHVLHTVGPTDGDEETLVSCYQTLLDLCMEHNIRSVAIPCIATGIYGFPNADACLIALSTVRDWLQQSAQHRAAMDRIIFVTFMEQDVKLYSALPTLFFPVDVTHATDATYVQPQAQTQTQASAEEGKGQLSNHGNDHDHELNEAPTEDEDEAEVAASSQSTASTSAPVNVN